MEDFPTPASFISIEELEQELQSIASSEPVIKTGEYLIPNMAPDRSVKKQHATPIRGNLLLVPEHSKLDLISGIFTGLERAKCRRSDEKLSPYEYWNIHKAELLQQVGPDQPEKLDSIFWSRVRGCGNFKPRVAAAIMQHFGATRVLDFSAGWGDRLLAAIALGLRYVGVDPNPNLQEPYSQIIDTLVPEQERSLYTMIESPFQTAVLPGSETFDLVFTSPPYYNLELYSTEVEGGSLDGWKTEFLYPSIQKAWDVLDIGGHLCLSINDYNLAERVKYVEDMVRYVSTLPGAESLNRVYRDTCVPYLASTTGSGDTITSAAPLWSWRKGEKIQVLSSLVNPPVVLDQVTISGDRIINIVRDDLLEGSTKQRAAYPYLASFSDYSEFVYAGHEGGHGHLCIAIVAELLGKKATLFLQSAGVREHPLVAASRSHNAKIYLIPDKLYVVRDDATKYVARTQGAMLVPLGMDNAEYQAHMVRALAASFPANIEPRRMWVVAGSGRVARSLMEVFPRTEFLTVRVGRDIDLKTTYTSNYKLGEEAVPRDLPPYPASRTYDAKLWPYVKQYALDGDYVWNVAGWM